MNRRQLYAIVLLAALTLVLWIRFRPGSESGKNLPLEATATPQTSSEGAAVAGVEVKTELKRTEATPTTGTPALKLRLEDDNLDKIIDEDDQLPLKVTVPEQVLEDDSSSGPSLSVEFTPDGEPMFGVVITEKSQAAKEADLLNRKDSFLEREAVEDNTLEYTGAP